jgi:hypothetical protein
MGYPQKGGKTKKKGKIADSVHERHCRVQLP